MSGSSRINWLLLLVVVGVFALNWSLEADPSRTNYEFLPGMVYAVPAESFAASGVFEDGAAMRRPPAGTIPRQRLPLRYEPTPEDAERAGFELTNPFSDREEAAGRGESVYGIYCRLCHGPGGEGDGTVAQRGFPTPPSLLAPNARQLADGRILHIVTFGQGNMPGHAAQIEPGDRWRVVAWVRELQAATPPVEPTAVPEPVTEESEIAGAPAATDDEEAER